MMMIQMQINKVADVFPERETSFAEQADHDKSRETLPEQPKGF